MSSRILDLSKRNEISISYTEIFLAETTQIGISDYPKFRKILPWLFSLNSVNWFTTPGPILMAELFANQRESTYWMLPLETIDAMISGSMMRIQKDNFQNSWEDIRNEMEENYDLGSALRKELLNQRAINSQVGVSFDAFWEKNKFNLLNFFVKRHADPLVSYQIWTKRPEACLFTKNYLKCLAASTYLPLADHNLKTHRNDTDDACQLSYLTWADVIVSNDTKFMKSCFDLVFAGSGKEFMNLNDFLIHLECLEKRLN